MATLDHTSKALRTPIRIQPSTGGANQAQEITPPVGAQGFYLTTEGGAAQYGREGSDGSTQDADKFTTVPAGQRVRFDFVSPEQLGQSGGDFYIGAAGTADYVSIEYV